MTCKRRNHGRSKHCRGRCTPVHCYNCGRLTPKDKAVKRFVVRNMLDQASARDVAESSPVYSQNFPSAKALHEAALLHCLCHPQPHGPRQAREREEDPLHLEAALQGGQELIH